MFVSEKIDCQEGTKGHNKGNGYITRNVCATREKWHYSQQIVYEYKEECRQQIGRILPVLGAYRILDDLVVDHHYDWFEQRRYARGLFFEHIVPAVPAGAQKHQHYKQHCSEHHRGHILGY